MKQVDDLRVLYTNVARHDTGICQCQTCEKIRIVAARILPTFFAMFDSAQELVTLEVGKRETALRDAMTKVKQF